jgi:ribosomal protein S12 methylthiotransferase
MKRGVTAERQRRLIEKLRATIPGLTLRTTFIVGFPGETDEDFEALCAFAREVRFDRLGCFRYSDEAGTAAQLLPNKVPRSLARSRHKRLLELQHEILAGKLAALVGSEQDVLVDASGPHVSQARLASQAPEIDGGVLLRGACQPGELRRARITAVRGGVDLEAEAIA